MPAWVEFRWAPWCVAVRRDGRGGARGARDTRRGGGLWARVRWAGTRRRLRSCSLGRTPRWIAGRTPAREKSAEAAEAGSERSSTSCRASWPRPPHGSTTKGTHGAGSCSALARCWRCSAASALAAARRAPWVGPGRASGWRGVARRDVAGPQLAAQRASARVGVRRRRRGPAGRGARSRPGRQRPSISVALGPGRWRCGPGCPRRRPPEWDRGCAGCTARSAPQRPRSGRDWPGGRPARTRMAMPRSGGVGPGRAEGQRGGELAEQGPRAAS